MKKQRQSAKRRSAEAVNRASSAIREAGWSMRLMVSPTRSIGRYVATKRTTESDDTVTTLYESDYTIEGLAALVRRREREENR